MNKRESIIARAIVARYNPAIAHEVLTDIHALFFYDMRHNPDKYQRAIDEALPTMTPANAERLARAWELARGGDIPHFYGTVNAMIEEGGADFIFPLMRPFDWIISTGLIVELQAVREKAYSHE